VNYGDLGSGYQKKIKISTLPAYEATFDRVVKLAGPRDRYDFLVKVTSGRIGYEYDYYDWEVKIAGPYDTFDCVVKVINPEDLPGEYR
jgi:hypothetical protein